MELTIEIGILALCACPLLVLTARSTFVREYSGLAIPLYVALGSYALAITALAFCCPMLLRAAAAIAVVVLLGLLFRARSSYGASKGLPPGSLSLTQSLDALCDPDFFGKQAARYGPIFKFSLFHQPALCVVGLDRGGGLLDAHKAHLQPAWEAETIKGTALSEETTLGDENHRHTFDATLLRQAAVRLSLNVWRL